MAFKHINVNTGYVKTKKYNPLPPPPKKNNNSQIAVVVQGLADLFWHSIVDFHDGRLVTATIAVIRRAENRTDSLSRQTRKRERVVWGQYRDWVTVLYALAP